MNYSSYIMIVFAIYLTYYAGNILYDTFLNKNKKKVDEDEEVIVLNDQEETPQEVMEEEEEEPPQETEDEEEKDYINNVSMVVENQGIPLEQLIQEGKSLFANVSF